MIFQSFNYFLEFPDLFLNQKVTYCVSTLSCLRQQVNSADQVKPDQWGPLVSLIGLRWSLTCGSRLV